MIFGVKYGSQDNMDHLIALIKKTYTLTKDWMGNLYCGICLDWDYTNCMVNISIPGYIKKRLQQYSHIASKQVQNCPFMPASKQFGSKAQTPLPLDSLPKLDKVGIKKGQKIVGSILYCARAVDMTVLIALSTIAAKQTISTKPTLERRTQMLDCLVHNANTKVRFQASDMIMNIHLDASYLSEAKACSQTCGHFFMGWMPKDGDPIKINGAFCVSVNILRFVVASTAEAELGTLYHNCQTGIVFCQTLEAMGHKQPKTPVHCDNATSVGIVNNTVEQQCLQSMEMHFFWISDKMAQDMYALSWHPGQENLADYQSKHHAGAYHIAICPWYLHMDNSPQKFLRALAPSALKGCVGTLNDRYVRKVHLPCAPLIQSIRLVTRNGTVTRDTGDTC
jgi:hypothetical protein